MAPLRAQSASCALLPAPSAAEAAVAVLASRAAGLQRVSGGSMLEVFASTGDPRRRRGIRHPLATILALCTAAVLSVGCLRLTDITCWICGADQDLLAALGCRQRGDGRCAPPHPDTVERVFALLVARGRDASPWYIPWPISADPTMSRWSGQREYAISQISPELWEPWRADRFIWTCRLFKTISCCGTRSVLRSFS